VRGVPREWHLIEHTARDDALFVYQQGARHCVHVVWRDGDFLCWYVNLEDPWLRTRFGYDSRDLLLDIWVDPDGTWRFLDEDELDEATRNGIVTAAEAAAVRTEGERVAEMIERWEPPFSNGWENWRPDPEWPNPELPDDWAAA